jgi:hypothetical protein
MHLRIDDIHAFAPSPAPGRLALRVEYTQPRDSCPRGSQPTITINGVNSTVTLTGACGEVNVAGTNNTVHLATVAQVDATGTGNIVTWQTGPGGLSPRISNTGIRNTVNQG